MPARWVGLGIVVLFAIGCGSPSTGVPDAADLEPAQDSGFDAGIDDAGAIVEDAGWEPSEDAGIEQDAGTPDAGEQVDGGVTPPVDPCAAAVPTCPATTATEGGGLVPIDRCAFPIDETAAFTTAPALITALEGITTPVSVAQVMADLNRVATSASTVPGNPAGVSFAIRWNTEDDTSSTWIPQGISGSADSSATGLVDGKRIVLSSWYHSPATGSPNKGVRIAFLDATQPAQARYRFALLVVPTGTPQAPDYQPLTLHAGGIVWYGDLLYVADTSRGFRVFDLRKILRVATDLDEIGCTNGTCRAGLYKYVLPQVGAYQSKSTCGARFSFVSLDRQSDPPALVSGEYCTDGTCATPMAGRVFRWPLDSVTGRLTGPRSWPMDAYLMGQRQVQGAATRNGVYFLSSSKPAGTAGALYRVTATKSATSTWNDGPEDLMIDHVNGLLYSQSEYSPRVVFAAGLASYPAP